MSVFKTREDYDNDIDDDIKKSSAPLSPAGKAIVVFFLLWIIAGLVAFVWSLACFGKSGTTAQKVIGLVVSIFFGPFYWIYYGVSKDYCR